MDTSAFLDYLEREKQDILAHCTRCGKCVEVCPMTQYSDVHTQSPELVVREVAALLETGVPTPAASAWASSCSNSGHCIPACPEGVNPRKMLALARLELRRHEAMGEVAPLRQAGRTKFKGLHDAIRLLLSVQLLPEEIERLLPGSVRQRQRPAEVVFYFGCNILKTPDIALNVLDVLDRLQVDYEVAGGTANCCGINFMRAGDPETSYAQASQTLHNMQAFEPQEILSWCASCNVHMHDFVPPEEYHRTPMRHLTAYLVDRLEDLQRLFVQPVRKRVALHEHDGLDGVVADVRRLLGAVPGLELVSIPQLHDQGHMCSGLAYTPAAKDNVHRVVLTQAAEAGVDVLADIYHACHRELVASEADYPFAIQNFMGLIGEAMGLSRADLYKRMVLYQDLEQVMREAAPYMAANGANPELVQLQLPGALWS
jgi:Fe-S oxidoreductase